MAWNTGSFSVGIPLSLWEGNTRINFPLVKEALRNKRCSERRQCNSRMLWDQSNSQISQECDVLSQQGQNGDVEWHSGVVGKAVTCDAASHIGPGSYISSCTSDPTPCLAWENEEKVSRKWAEDGPRAWVLTTHVGDPDKVLVLWLLAGPA